MCPTPKPAQDLFITFSFVAGSLANAVDYGSVSQCDLVDNILHTSTVSPHATLSTLHRQYPESFLHVNISPFIFPISPPLRVHLSYPQSNSCERFCDLSYPQPFLSIPVQYFPVRRADWEREACVVFLFLSTSLVLELMMPLFPISSSK